MAETYDITHEGAPVGTARMEKQGLYYVFSCRCRLPEEGLYRIHAINGETREDLGICVPIGSAFGMDKKIPAKRLGEGNLTFELLPKDWKPQPVKTEPKQEKIVLEEILPEDEPVIMETKKEILPPAGNEEIFVPVSEDEPFEYLNKLENARMEIREDTPGILIEE